MPTLFRGPLAQWVADLAFNQVIEHSNCSRSSIFPPNCFKYCFLVGLLSILLLIGAGKAFAADESNYLGSKVCAGCHQEQYKSWQRSDHFKAMEVASERSVLGEFTGSQVTFHGVTNRFYLQNDKYLVEITEPGKAAEQFEILFTFGFYPLQQYLIELNGGFIQALNVAWDSRSKEQGGQHWFHLQPDETITPDHPFHWKRHFQNWNARCSDCHSTNLIKNYDSKSHSYSTRWSEINVACEACHGSGKKHVELVKSNTYGKSSTGFSVNAPKPVQWKFTGNDPIAKPTGKSSEYEINTCGTCHSLRSQLSSPTTGQNYHDQHRIELINDAVYFPDGQIREESFVLGSFMQSKMYERGVTCSNCHDAHSGKTIAEGNGLCAQCHQPKVFDVAEHHHHKSGSKGAQCVNCHMPERTYMQVDKRRDHSFSIPRPELSLDLGVPNACTQCHIERKNNWAMQVMQDWKLATSKNHWAYLSQAAQNSDVLVTRPLTDLLNQQQLPAMTQASLMGQLANVPSRVSVETARGLLANKSPMVRRGAVTSLRNIPVTIRWQLLSPYIKDRSKSVRFEIAASLFDVYSQLQPQQQKQLDPLRNEYRESLNTSRDLPATQLAIANLELNLGNMAAAEQAYLQALRIESNLVPALINLADYYRRAGRESEGLPLLKRALKVAPDSGAANHTYGLYLIRQQKHDEAQNYLKSAIDTEDAVPRFAYVYAIALESTGDIDQALKSLEMANVRWPNQYELLLTLVDFLDKKGDVDNIYPYISNLSKIAPGSPDTKHFVKKYSSP